MKFLKSKLAKVILALICLSAVSSVITTLILKQNPKILDNAIFYSGQRPEPADITFTNTDGDSVTLQAYPGQIHLAVQPKTPVSKVKGLIGQYDGKIAGQIPALGIYLIEIKPGSEASFISGVQKDSVVLNASPNPLIQLSEYEVDLSDKGLTGKGQDISKIATALLKTPDPNAKVIMAQLDDFKNPHGGDVQAVMQKITGTGNTLKVHLGALPCGGLNPSLCSSGDQSIRGLAAVIAGAEINQQQVSINMSWGVSPTVSSPQLFEQAKGPNSWAAKSWANYTEQILDVLAASELAKNGQVILNKSGDNGVTLVNDKGQVINNTGVDTSAALEKWGKDPRYQSVLKNNILFYGALESNGTKAQYSNFGPGFIWAVAPKPGTSFVAPQGWGTTYGALKANSALKSGELVKIVRETATKNGNGFNVLNTTKVLEQAKLAAPSTDSQKPSKNFSWDGVYTVNFQGQPCNEGSAEQWTANITVKGNAVISDSAFAVVSAAPIDASGRTQARYSNPGGPSDDFFTFSRNGNDASVNVTYTLYWQTESGSGTCYGAGSGKRISQ